MSEITDEIAKKVIHGAHVNWLDGLYDLENAHSDTIEDITFAECVDSKLYTTINSDGNKTYYYAYAVKFSGVVNKDTLRSMYTSYKEDCSEDEDTPESFSDFEYNNYTDNGWYIHWFEVTDENLKHVHSENSDSPVDDNDMLITIYTKELFGEVIDLHD